MPCYSSHSTCVVHVCSWVCVACSSLCTTSSACVVLTGLCSWDVECCTVFLSSSRSLSRVVWSSCRFPGHTSSPFPKGFPLTHVLSCLTQIWNPWHLGLLLEFASFFSSHFLYNPTILMADHFWWQHRASPSPEWTSVLWVCLEWL